MNQSRTTCLICCLSHLIFLAANPLQITPRSLIHRVGVTEIRCRFIILPCSSWILVDAPAITEAVGQLEDSEDKFAFRGAALFHACA